SVWPRRTARRSRSMPRPRRRAPASVAIARTKSVMTTPPVMIAAHAASRIEGGRSVAPQERPAMAMTGRAARARTFHTPVTTAIVVTAATEKPQDLAIEYVAASPTAPPPGRRLDTDEPQTLRISARG